jgi:hypothetical protein
MPPAQLAATSLKINRFIEFSSQFCGSSLKIKEMNSRNIPDLSFYRLSLMGFLRESHPHLLADHKFIASRTEAALDVYRQAVRNGNNPLEAEEQADSILFEGLHFSKHDTIKK